MTDKEQAENRCVLIVGAHPDDADFTCGGSIARWIAEGWTARLVVCTDGSKGSHDPAVIPARLAARRQEEQLAAAEVLGISEAVFLNNPDGELNRAVGLVAEITRPIRRFRPQRVLAWDPWRRYQLHPDHRAAGLATLDAVLAAGNPHYFPEQVAQGLATHQLQAAYLFGADSPDVWVDISSTFERKLGAIACHRSQVERLPKWAEEILRCNADCGRQPGCNYAEAFKLLRSLCDT